MRPPPPAHRTIGGSSMRRLHKLLLTTLAATLLLAAATSTASARNFSISNQNFRVVWRELNFGGIVTCELTLEGSFHYRTIVKREGALVGLVTRAIVRHPCRSGEGWTDNGTEEFLGSRTINSLPRHITYQGFLGTLPAITGIRLTIMGPSFVASSPGICLARYGLAEDNVTMLATITAGVVGNATPVAGANSITRREVFSGGFCPATGTLTGEGPVTLLGNTTRLTLTLI
jgi:hypothetical protein